MSHRALLFLVFALLASVLSAQNPALQSAATAADSIAVLVPRQSPMRYGYSEFCTANERLIYDLTVDSFICFSANGVANGWIENRVFIYPSEVGATRPTLTQYMNLVNRMQRDMPELYILSSYIPRNPSTGEYYIRLFRSYTPSMYASEMAAIDSIASSIISGITSTMSEHDKVLLLHDSLCALTRYGGMSSAYAGGIKGVFLEHRAVCEGWSRSFLYLCQRAGIRCLYIDGALNQTPDEATPTWGSHAWNFVEVDGRWFLVDATSDGGLGTIGHRAFLRGQDYFDANYTLLFNGTGANENATAYPTLPTLCAYDWSDTLPVALPSVAPEVRPVRKTLRDGRLLLLTPTATYDALGRRVE